MMERKITKELKKWSKKPNHKPLIVRGARQIGKTYLIKQFGRENYKKFIYLNFETNKEIDQLFGDNITPSEIIKKIEAYFGENISPTDTLLFFDEIQSSNRALTSLKYFRENAPEYNIIAAGSLLGIAINKNDFSFPVGQVEFAEMYPMDFEEFLWSLGRQELANQIRQAYDENQEFFMHDLAMKLYDEYLIVGGMPEAVATYNQTNSYFEVGDIQEQILSSYTSDMTKYASPEEAVRIIETFDSIPAQLAKENHKFQYKVIKQGGTASLFGSSIAWLVNAGIVQKCSLVSQVETPLAVFASIPSFKLYMTDTGLLMKKSGILPQNIISSDFSSNFIGALAENYVAAALAANGCGLYYWTSGNTAEVDFVIQNAKGEIVPIEVKAGLRTKSRSLSTYRAKYSPKLSIRVSAKNFGLENGVKSVPLYAAFCIK